MNHLEKLKEIKTLSCPQVNRHPNDILDDIFMKVADHIEDYEYELADKKEKLKKFMKICFGISLGYVLLVLAMCL